MYDLIVIGGGPAGVTAALRGRELGASVALVERDAMGGVCTNDGCVPTRVLAKAARLMRDSEQLDDYGLVAPRPSVDFARLMDRTLQLVQVVHQKKRLVEHLSDAGVAVYKGEASFAGEQAITLVNGTQLEARTFVICAGGHARRLPIPGGDLALTHSDVWALRELPRFVAIVGAGATGCQLASIFNAFGAHVWLLEMAPHILPGEDERVSEAIDAAFRRRGIDIVTGMGGLEGIEEDGGRHKLNFTEGEQSRSVRVERVILAVGWPGNVDALNLAAAGVRAERGYIRVDDQLRTSTPHIFAAGDITGRIMLVQTASYDATAAVENALGAGPRTLAHHIVPHGGFTDPEYGSVGLTEKQAHAQQDCVVAEVPYADLDRAVIDGKTEGFCKLIVSRGTREILGAHVVGEQAVEVVQIVAAAMASGARIEHLAQVELAYPTFTAIVGIAARQIVRELGDVPVAPAWRTLQHPRGAEWERRELA